MSCEDNHRQQHLSPELHAEFSDGGIIFRTPGTPRIRIRDDEVAAEPRGDREPPEAALAREAGRDGCSDSAFSPSVGIGGTHRDSGATSERCSSSCRSASAPGLSVLGGGLALEECGRSALGGRALCGPSVEARGLADDLSPKRLSCEGDETELRLLTPGIRPSPI